MPGQAPLLHVSTAVAAARKGSFGVHLLNFAVWLAVGFAAVTWGLRLWPQPSTVPVVELAAPPPQRSAADIAQALGAPHTAAAAPALASRLQLLGVVADADGFGAALIAIDGQPPKPYRIGKPVLDGLLLKAVQARSATLGEGPAALTLNLPARP